MSSFSSTGGDDETILVDLGRLPPHVDQIVFTVNSFTGQTFAEVQNAFCRRVDETTSQELARYTLSGGGRTPRRSWPSSTGTAAAGS